MCKLSNSMIVVLTLLVVVAFVPAFNTRAAVQATPTPTPAPARTPSPPPEGNDQRAAALLEQGIDNIEAEDYEQAIEKFDKTIELNPNLAVAYLYRGIAHAGSGNSEQAIADLEHYLELASDAPDREDITSYVESLRTGGVSRTVQAWLISEAFLHNILIASLEKSGQRALFDALGA
jgi:tetratricopeptide (TPR) repeat protein